MIHRLRLSTIFAVINLALLVLVVTLVAMGALGLLRRLADEQALARVRQAGFTAAQLVERSGEEVATTARLLGERPTLRRLLLEGGGRQALEAFLSRFQRTGRLDGTAVVLNDQVVIGTGRPAPWAQMWASRTGPHAYFLHRTGGGEPMILWAWAPVSTIPRSAVAVAVLLGERYARNLEQHAGLPVRVLDRDEVRADSANPAAPLRAAVIDSGQMRAARVAGAGRYLAVVPLRAPDGATPGALEISLPTAGVAASMRRLIRALVLLSLGIAALAALVSLVAGRWVGGPLRALTRAAARIGRGDLETPVRPARGAEIGALAVTLEEMRRNLHQATGELWRQQAEARAILSGIVEGVFTVDADRRIRYVNPQAAAMLELDPAEVVGRFCGDVLNPQGPDGIRPCERDCPILHARFRQGAQATEHLLLRSGQRRSVVIASAPAVGGQQVQVMRDETEREFARRMRDTILANISHEFRTPLSAQLASIELLLDQLAALEPEQVAQLIGSLQRSTLRLTHLIDNLLESAGIEAGRDSLRRVTVALDEVVEAALEVTRPLLAQRDQAVEVDLPYPLPAARGDPTRLTLVFVNLLANANKFAPAGSTIHLGGTVEEDAVAIWVQDEGPGLPAQTESWLFDRFARASGEEPEQSGMGLGLWIAKSVVERHGGTMRAESGGQGTRVVVRLPREDVREDPGC